MCKVAAVQAESGEGTLEGVIGVSCTQPVSSVLLANKSKCLLSTYYVPPMVLSFSTC